MFRTDLKANNPNVWDNKREKNNNRLADFREEVFKNVQKINKPLKNTDVWMGTGAWTLVLFNLFIMSEQVFWSDCDHCSAETNGR